MWSLCRRWASRARFAVARRTEPCPRSHGPSGRTEPCPRPCCARLPPQVFKWGSLGNFLAFFISGLPGGVDYWLLGRQKLSGSAAEALAEKATSANLNTWVRVPGILFATTLLYQALLLGNYAGPELGGPPRWALLVQQVLPPFNALYFSKQASANYAVHYMLSLLGQDELIKHRIEVRTSKTTGTEVMSWRDASGRSYKDLKEAVGVPQRGS